ncbi:MAG: Ldh family oxidoreductase [Pseudomonadales bacterium]
MTSINLTLKEIEQLATDVFQANGCDEANTNALVNTVVTAERDGSHSHGMFRVPGYVAALRSGKVNGHAAPKVSNRTAAIVNVHGDNGYAPLAMQRGIPALAEAAETVGVGVMAMTHVHHFAALWPETEALAERNLIAMACVCYMPSVAPAGGNQKLLGTNPMSFAWPRPGKTPFVFDMATAAMALGEVQIAARDGRQVDEGVGLDSLGQPTTDPAEIVKGMLLPFGGHKGSAIAIMVELLASAAINEQFSYEAKANDNGDGGPPRGGEFMLAISPELLAGEGWADHAEGFFEKLEAIEGTRLPGARRHTNRLSDEPRAINADLVEKVRGLL